MSGTMFCGNCGLELAQGYDFCPRCGTTSDLMLATNKCSQNMAEQFCIVCGAPLVCPVCTSQIPTKTLSPPGEVAALISSIPTRSLHLETPSLEQISGAIVSKNNPYAPWGTLVVDESEKEIWEKGKKPGCYECGYQDGSFIVTSRGPRHIWMANPASLDNFAYQVVVTGGPHPVGLLFHANSAHTCYYQLMKESIWLELYSIDGKTERRLHQFRSDDQQWYGYDGQAYKNKPVLLGIVVQGSTIDVYENLTHLGRVKDESRSAGEIGLFVTNHGIFSHTKVWKKHESKPHFLERKQHGLSSTGSA